MKSFSIRIAILLSFSLLCIFNLRAENAVEVKIRWDKAPFSLYQEQKNFKSNHLTDNDAVSSNYGVRTYALPKNLPVSVLAKGYMGAKIFYYVQLPDGSLGYVPGYAIDETRIGYSNDWSGTAEHFNGWTRSEKRVGKEIYPKYVWTAPVVTARTDKGIRKVELNHVMVSEDAVKSFETETDKHISDHTVIVIKNPEAIKNLVGYDKKYVERKFGKAKNFAGDALTEVGYAYSYYQNIAIPGDPDKYKIYGMAVYYNKDMHVVDAAFLTSVDGNFRKETVRKSKLPEKPGSLCGYVNVASGHQKVSGLPTYDVKRKYQSYKQPEGSGIYSRLLHPEKPWHLGLAALCLTFILAVLGCIEAWISKKEHSVFFILGYVVVVAAWIYSLILYFPNGLISAVVNSLIVMAICMLPVFIAVIILGGDGEAAPRKCPYCDGEDCIQTVNDRLVNTYRYITEKEKYIRSTYETIYNDNFDNDLADASPYKSVWTSMVQENKEYQEVRIIEYRERRQSTYRCEKCHKQWEGIIYEITKRTETELGKTFWKNGGFSNVKSITPPSWDMIDDAKHRLRNKR